MACPHRLVHSEVRSAQQATLAPIGEIMQVRQRFPNLRLSWGEPGDLAARADQQGMLDDP